MNPQNSKNLGYCGADIVLKSTGHIPNNKGYKLYFDNYFTYSELLVELKSKNILAVGTLRSDHIGGCILKPEKDLKKYGRGSYDSAVEEYSMIRIVGWLDNRAVQLASNFPYIEPLHKCKRYSKKERKDLEILQPSIVKLYSSSMSGVDLFDMFQNVYRLHHKSKKWYMRVFFWILGTSLFMHGYFIEKKVNFFKYQENNFTRSK